MMTTSAPSMSELKLTLVDIRVKCMSLAPSSVDNPSSRAVLGA